MFKQLINYIWASPEQKDDLLEEAIAASSEVEVSVPQTEKTEPAGYSSTKTGHITKSKNGLHMIDEKFEYKSNSVNLEVGTQVTYTLYKEGNVLKVSNVEIYDLWGLQTVESENLICNRITIAQVEKRDGRIIHTKPDGLKIDLNVTLTEFIPFEGDWLELDIKTELNEGVTNLFGKIIEVNKIRPLRSKVIEGVVRLFDNNTYSGIINRDVYFNREAIADGYLPQVGDHIVSEVIESNHDDCLWRALKIVLNTNCQRSFQQFEVNSVDLIKYEQNVDGIEITNDISLNCGDFNTGKRFEIEIMNSLESDLILLDVRFDSAMSQLELKSAKSAIIKSNTSLKLDFVVNAKSLGESKELVIFIFKDFNIGRSITINLIVNSYKYREQQVRKTSGNNINSMRNFRNENNHFIKGQTIKASPRFVGNRIGEYKIPDKLWDIFLYYDAMNSEHLSHIHNDVMNAYPVLKQAVNFQTYERTFHTLLHIDEIEGIIAFRKFDQDRACFIRNGEYLMLEIENLAEKRPSLIMGDKIIATHPQNSGVNFEGYIHKVSANHVSLKFAQIMHDTYKGEDYAIRAVQSRMVMRKLHHAIYTAICKLGKEILFPTHVMSKKSQVNFTYEKYYDSFTKRSTPHKKSNRELLQLIKNNYSSTSDSDTTSDEQKIESEMKQLKLEWFNKSLNYYQKEAVRNILLGEARPLPYVIFGPPGTGKTVTVIESVLQILRMMPHSRLLIATPSNSASDLVTSRLIDAGLKPGDMVRFVSYKVATSDNIDPKLAPYCITGNICREGTNNDEMVTTEKGLILGAGYSVIGRHRITIGTCSALGLLHIMGFKPGHFTHIIVDEAGQCTEPEIMIPITFIDQHQGQIILAGDNKQLGPVILSRYAAELGLSESYFERILNRVPYTRDTQGFPKSGGFDPRVVTCLVYNYRSLPGIIELPNKMFYFSDLKATISEMDSIEAKFLQNLREILPIKGEKLPNVIFHGIMGEDVRSEDSPSWFNPDEASQVFYYINQLYRLGVKSTDVGIIAPYIKQVRHIRSLLEEAEFDLPKIGTVEEFQGQEFNVIIISTVRSNTNLLSNDLVHRIGFISNPKRLNVALTRAQCLNIIIGNPKLLMNDANWHIILKTCVKNNAYLGCEL